jgi:hypothetical protein
MPAVRDTPSPQKPLESVNKPGQLALYFIYEEIEDISRTKIYLN